MVIQREAELIIPKIKGVCIPLCVEGKQLSSEELADFIRTLSVSVSLFHSMRKGKILPYSILQVSDSYI